MTDVTPLKAPIQSEQVAYRMPVSENLMNQIGESINYALKATSFLGQIFYAALTEEQFAAIIGYDPLLPENEKPWVIMKGQSIVGSDYYSLTSIATLPNAQGNGAFLGQISSGPILQYESSKNTAHDHGGEALFRTFDGGSIEGGWVRTDGVNYLANTSLAGNQGTAILNNGDVGQPNAVRVNIFLKINI
jgi:hypothetical protein